MFRILNLDIFKMFIITVYIFMQPINLSKEIYHLTVVKISEFLIRS